MVKLADRITNLQPPPGHWGAEKVESNQEEGRDILKELGEHVHIWRSGWSRKYENMLFK